MDNFLLENSFNFVDIAIDDFSFDEADINNNELNYKLSYKINFNMEKYNNKINQLKN